MLLRTWFGASAIVVGFGLWSAGARLAYQHELKGWRLNSLGIYELESRLRAWEPKEVFSLTYQLGTVLLEQAP